MRRPLPGACVGLSVISSSPRAGVGDLADVCGTKNTAVSLSTLGWSPTGWLNEGFVISATSVLGCSSSLRAYTSRLGAESDDCALRMEVAESSVSSFRRFAEMFAYFAELFVSVPQGFATDEMFSSVGVEIGGWLRALLSDVGRVEGCGASSKLRLGLLRVGTGKIGVGGASVGTGANVSPKSTSLTCRFLNMFGQLKSKRGKRCVLLGSTKALLHSFFACCD